MISRYGPNMPLASDVAWTPPPLPPEPVDLTVSTSDVNPLVLTGVPIMPGGDVPTIGIPNSQDYPRLAFTAPYFIPGAPQLTGGTVNGALTVMQPFTNPATANYWSTQTPPANIARLGDRVLIGAEAQLYDGTGEFGVSTSTTWVATIGSRVYDYLEIQGRLLSYSTPGVFGQDSRTISAFFASKTSDLSSDQNCCAIPVAALGYNNNSSNPSDCWMYYGTGVRLTGAGSIQNEIDIANAGELRTLTPYGAVQTPLPGGHTSGMSIGLILASGGELATAPSPPPLNPCSCALWVGNNGGLWDKGIIIETNALQADKAICFGNGHALCWYDLAGGSSGADTPYIKLQAFDNTFGTGDPGIQINGGGLDVVGLLAAQAGNFFTGVLTSLPPAGNVVANSFQAMGSSASLFFEEQTNIANRWGFFAASSILNMWSSTNGTVATLNSSGTLNPSGGYETKPGFGAAPTSHSFNIDFPGAGPAHLWIDTADMGSINTTPCDERLKTNFAPPTVDALAAINAIVLKQFDWLANDVVPAHHENIGFTAQQLNEAIPDAVTVHDDPEAMLSVQLTPIVAHLIGAVQQLSWRLGILEGRA